MLKLATKYIFTSLLLLITVLSFVTNWYSILVLSLTLLLVLMILDKMGKGIVLRESTAMMYTITCLLMPLVGYTYYTFNNPLARLWVKYMPVPENIYFDFALPAICSFCLMLTWPLGVKETLDEGERMKWFISRIKNVLVKDKYKGIYIMVTGVLLSLVIRFLPNVLLYFVTLFFIGSFAGLLYVYFAPKFPYKNLTMIGFSLFILSHALNTGMFSIIAYMGVTIYSFFLVGKNTSFLKKAAILLAAISFIIVLQNVKLAYRRATWINAYSGNKGELFGRLFWENLQKGSGLITEDAFFSIYARTNQGFNIALVMKRFPAYKSHDNGSNLMMSFASALIPRLLWPDKPEAGGKFNMKYYTGINISGWSTNVGPLGEGYGSFGKTGGIIFMLALGFVIRWAYRVIFVIGKSIPLLVCWIPVLFYQITYSAETDTLQILNSLFKTSFFIFILYKAIPLWFDRKKKNQQRRQFVPVNEPRTGLS